MASTIKKFLFMLCFLALSLKDLKRDNPKEETRNYPVYILGTKTGRYEVSFLSSRLKDYITLTHIGEGQKKNIGFENGSHYLDFEDYNNDGRLEWLYTDSTATLLHFYEVFSERKITLEELSSKRTAENFNLTLESVAEKELDRMLSFRKKITL